MRTIKEKTRPHSKPSHGRNPWPPVAGRRAQKVDNRAAQEKQELESKPSGVPSCPPAAPLTLSTSIPSQGRKKKKKAKRLGQRGAGTEESQDAPGEEWRLSPFSPYARERKEKAGPARRHPASQIRHLPLRPAESWCPLLAFPEPPPPLVVPSPAGKRRHSGGEKGRTGSPAALRLRAPQCAPAAPAPRGAEWARPSQALARGGNEAGPRGGAPFLVQIA